MLVSVIVCLLIIIFFLSPVCMHFQKMHLPTCTDRYQKALVVHLTMLFSHLQAGIYYYSELFHHMRVRMRMVRVAAK